MIQEPTQSRKLIQESRELVRRGALQLLLLLGVIAASPLSVSAQPLIDIVPSIDSLVINADYVYVGTIIKVRDEPIPGGSDMPGFSFEVEDYLKTPMQEEPTPEIRQRGMFVTPPTTKYKDWMKRSSRLLIIVVESRPHEPVMIELAPDRPDVFTAELKLLHDPNEIIEAAKEAIERTPRNIRRVHTHLLMVSHEIYEGTRWGKGGGVRVEVPADARLEKWAMESISDDDPQIRLQATRSLRYFKSNLNAKLLSELQKDPDPNVRQAAEKILRRWEIKEPSQGAVGNPNWPVQNEENNGPEERG